jgi:NAD(P)H-dependent flavin oxidoreductase YrpB (nitropropane dioxygenase family)
VPRAARGKLLGALGIELPVLAAPMAGGPGSPELVIAAGRAGSLGFLGAGYKTAEAMAAEIATVRAAGVPFGVNLFVPNALPVEREAFRRYAETLRGDFDAVGVDLASVAPREDEDSWREKLDVLAVDAPAVVSFTFGIPGREDLAALRDSGAILVQGVTSPEEADAAVGAGLDALAVQSSEAGGHWGTLTPREPPPVMPLGELTAAIAARTELPLIAAGGVAGPDQVARALAAGADAVMVGTALLLAEEAATAPVHRDALVDPERRKTVLTRAFTGRPARGLRNGFIDRHEPDAPLGYPAIHYLTAPMRRAAAAKGDPERLHLWAGTGFRAARAQPAGEILRGLAG